MMREPRRHLDLRGEQGQLLPMFAVGMFTLILFAGLVTNVGQAVVRKHQLQVIADMGAMAGAAEQARGLNTMARLNALNLRAFNVFQIRSRLGGYQTHRVPFEGTLQQLLTAVPKEIGPRTPSFLGIGGGCIFPLCLKARSILRRAISAVGAHLRLAAGVSLLPWDPYIRPKGSGEEVKAFRNMDKFHKFMRDTIKAANYYYAYNAHQVARQSTDANLKTLLGTDAPAGRQNSYQRLVKEYNDTSFSYVSDPYDINAKAANAINGIEGILEAFQDPATILNYLNGGGPSSATTLLGQVDAAFRPLIPNWENPDGDPLVVRFWSAMPGGFPGRGALLLQIGIEATLICGPCSIPITSWAGKLITFEKFMRLGSAPSYSTLNVTLHRAPGEDNETFFLHWVRTPTTESAVGRMLFADMPVMVAVAAAKPVGGNFGNHPRPVDAVKEALKDISPTFGSLLATAGKWVNKILPAVEYLDPGKQWSRYQIVPLEDKLSGDWVPTDTSFYWYRGQNFPTYEPRLMPIKPGWIPGHGLYEIFVARDVLEVDDMTRLVALNRNWNFE